MDHQARLWTAQGVFKRSLREHLGWVLDARFSPDSRTVVTAGTDGRARLFNVATGALERAFEASAQPVREAALVGATVVTVSDDGRVRSFARVSAHEARVGGAVTLVTPMGDATAFTGGDDGALRRWSVPSLRADRAASAHAGPMRALRVHAATRTVLNSRRRRRRAALGRPLARPSRGSAVTSDRFATRPSPRRRPRRDRGRRRPGQAPTASSMAVFRGHRAPVQSVNFSPDGRWIVSGSDDHTARVLPASLGELIARGCGLLGPSERPRVCRSVR